MFGSLRKPKRETASQKLTAREIDPGEVFFILNVERRRHIVELVRQRPRTRREIIDEITRIEVGDDYGSTERKRVVVAMHSHLPRMVDMGVLDKIRSDGAGEEMYFPGVDFDIMTSTLDHIDGFFE